MHQQQRQNVNTLLKDSMCKRRTQGSGQRKAGLCVEGAAAKERVNTQDEDRRKGGGSGSPSFTRHTREMWPARNEICEHFG